jgi:8-amino-7-oxononanoate synthase
LTVNQTVDFPDPPLPPGEAEKNIRTTPRPTRLVKSLEENLQQRHRDHLYRRREVLAGAQGVEVVVDNRRLLAFCSNDYLGLANHPEVVRALQDGAARYGAGAGASHLVSGHGAAHHALEEELAAFVGTERALLFSTGYMANLGVVSALVSRHATVFEDRLNHASLIDAARLARARVVRYPHADAARLAALMAAARAPELVTTDAVFSMDGDTAPLTELAALADRHGARLLADDAHGFGVLGATGRGSFEAQGVPLTPAVIYMGTLGKALGTFGAFVAGDAVLIETLIQQARTYIYTTALPPAVAEATRAALRLVTKESWRREHLRALVARFRAGAAQCGMRLAPSETAIQLVILGSADAALTASRALRERGIWVPAIRPPTVPVGSARLRITFSAAHSEEHVDRLVEALAGGSM